MLFHQGQEAGEARLVDSYANARVRRGDLQREVEITELEPAADPPTARRPVDNSLSASRLTLDKET